MADSTAIDVAKEWVLDPEVVFLNHGSFGACPRDLLAAQDRWRQRMERQPVQFFVRDLGPAIERARQALATFLRADPEGLALVPNATAGINAVLRSMPLQPGDELVTTNQEYNACRNTLEYVAERAGAKVIVADVPFPIDGPDTVVRGVQQAVTERTRLVLIDHVTSQTGAIWPLERIVPWLRERGVLSLIDGAHGPGMLDLDLTALDADFYTGNCHKWLCTPKGSALLHVRRQHRDWVRPIAISHGANAPTGDRSRFLNEFDWVGTDDPTPYLVIPDAIQWMGRLLPGGWSAVRAHNHRLVVDGRRKVAEALGTPLPCPDEMIGSIAALPLPDGSPEPPKSALYADPLQDRLLEGWRVEVPVVPWPAPPKRLIRVSAQLYNKPRDYETLASALRSIFG